jgi:hypothetical protein
MVSESRRVIVEPTASVFVLHQEDEGSWRCALIWHPRLSCWPRQVGT